MHFLLPVYLLLSCISYTSGLALNLTEIAHSLVQSKSNTLAPANWFPTCINGAQHPSWTGSIGVTTCTNVLLKLKSIAAPFGEREFTFFSNLFIKDAPDPSWSLPSGMSYGEYSAVALLIVCGESLDQETEVF